jgi:cation diffusion facilitator family transporter
MSHHNHDHDHNDNCCAHDDENIALLDSPDCQQFIESASRGHCHGHHHDHDHGGKVTWRLVTMLILTGIFFVAELVTGFITKSLALQSDAFHMLSDELSLIIGLVAHKMSKKKPTKRMTFGYARAGVLGGLCNAVFLLAICLTLFIEAIERIFKPESIKEPTIFIVVGVLGLLVNILGIFIFHDHDHSDNIKGIFLHILGDFFGSIAVVISACVVKFTNWKYKDYLDPCLSVLIIIILVYGSQNLLRRTGAIVLERCPEDVDIDEVRADLMKIDGIVSIHELHVWELSKEFYIALIHIVVDTKDKNRTVQEKAHNVMLTYRVYSTTIQIEFVDDFPQGTDHNDSCFYASTFGSKKRVFLTPPVYKHSIGCPHINIPGQEDDHDHDHDHGHNHDHDQHHDHEHDHNHEHSHDHDHDHDNENVQL